MKYPLLQAPSMQYCHLMEIIIQNKICFDFNLIKELIGTRLLQDLIQNILIDGLPEGVCHISKHFKRQGSNQRGSTLESVGTRHNINLIQFN